MVSADLTFDLTPISPPVFREQSTIRKLKSQAEACPSAFVLKNGFPALLEPSVFMLTPCGFSFQRGYDIAVRKREREDVLDLTIERINARFPKRQTQLKIGNQNKALLKALCSITHDRQ